MPAAAAAAAASSTHPASLPLQSFRPHVQLLRDVHDKHVRPALALMHVVDALLLGALEGEGANQRLLWVEQWKHNTPWVHWLGLNWIAKHDASRVWDEILL